MAFTKVVLLLALVCGVFSSAYAAGTGFESNRKLRTFNTSAQADSTAQCSPAPCFAGTKDKAFVKSFFSKAGSESLSTNGINTAAASGLAVAVGPNPRTKTTSDTIVFSGGAASQSSAKAKIGSGHKKGKGGNKGK